ncbi:DUF397 domain-containing protein [Nocardiopsis sp. LDBS1602]|uniref:DUF397 domain-containing protein n=1 Tax=Nocardiopsis sp. LDBS1602 TaxID=3109597 RepID=UPI002DBB994C|nr:DUF397 domain-containing protein [Nocardiopsis sp. LDBS1602]MEC3891164.1 DUF397 domain-containing protein [Nocardiopsis sp. LDBS1602]
MMTEEWNKSTYSNGSGGDCVEACVIEQEAAVRDTQNRELGHLSFSANEWTALLSATTSR